MDQQEWLSKLSDDAIIKLLAWYDTLLECSSRDWPEVLPWKRNDIKSAKSKLIAELKKREKNNYEIYSRPRKIFSSSFYRSRKNEKKIIMKKSVRKELSEMVYVFVNDYASAIFVNNAAIKMGVGVKYETRTPEYRVTLLFDPEDMDTPILQHNVKVILSRYEYALQTAKNISWWKRIFNFFKKIF